MEILIVEDSRFAQTVASRLLSEAFPDSKITISNNGLDGFHEFMRLKPDIIVTDLLMPIMNGQEFIKKIRELDQNIIIFVSTADIQQSIKAELAEYHIAAIINKPLNRDKISLIQQIVEERLHAE